MKKDRTFISFDNEAQKVLRYENMNPKDQLAYKRHIENKRIEMGITETAVDKTKRAMGIEIVKESLALSLPIETILKLSKLTLAEVQAIVNGEDIDKEDIED